MPTRTRTATRNDEDRARHDLYSTGLDIDDVTDADIEDFLSRHDEEETRQGFFNVPTIAGLATIGVGAAYLLERYDLLRPGFEIGTLVGPWLIGVLLILLGFVFLSWKPRRERRTAARRQAAERRARQRAERTAERPAHAEPRESARPESFAAGKKQFRKSARNRKITGVCGGIAEYFSIDPTIVRIAFVIAFLASGAMVVPLYLVLAFVMPRGEAAPPRAGTSDVRDDDRVVIIRS